MPSVSHSHLCSAAVCCKSKITPEDDAELCHEWFKGGSYFQHQKNTI